MRPTCAILFVVVCVWQTSEALTKVPLGLRGKLSEDDLEHVLEVQRDVVAAHPDFGNDYQLSLNDIKKGLSLYLVQRDIVSPDVSAEEFEQICEEALVEPCKKVAAALDGGSAGALAFRLSFCRLVAEDADTFCSSAHRSVAAQVKFGRN